MKRLFIAVVVVVCAMLCACGGSLKPIVAAQPAPVIQPPPPAPPAPPAPAPTPAPSTPQGIQTAVFIGDSITRGWDLLTYFPEKPYTNKGVSGNETSDMLARFTTDVISLHPDAVLIWGGTNDSKNWPVSMTEDYLQSMYEAARANGIVPIACTIMARGGTFADINPRLVQVNDWIRSYAGAHDMQVADYYAVTVAADGTIRADMTVDGVHLNTFGYVTITPVATSAIEAAHKP